MLLITQQSNMLNPLRQYTCTIPIVIDVEVEDIALQVDRMLKVLEAVKGSIVKE